MWLKQTPLSLDINTHRTKLRDFVDRIVMAKLGMSFPLIMHGSALLYEVGDDLDKDMVANYEANLEKVCFHALSCSWVVFCMSSSYLIMVFNVFPQVLSLLPSPVTGGTVLTVEDLQQELSCNINIKHRFVLNSLNFLVSRPLMFVS